MTSTSRRRKTYYLAGLGVFVALAGNLACQSSSQSVATQVSVPPTTIASAPTSDLDVQGLTAVAERLGEKYGDGHPDSFRAVATTHDKVLLYYGDTIGGATTGEPVVQLLVSGDFSEMVPSVSGKVEPGQPPKEVDKEVHGSLLEITVTRADLDVVDLRMVSDDHSPIDLATLGDDIVTVPL